jgi:hypothetical protein
MDGSSVAGVAPRDGDQVNTPNGLAEIVATFGDIEKYIDGTGLLAPSWNTDYLAIVELPFPIPLAWNKSVSVSRMTCHKLMVSVFTDVFNQIRNDGLVSAISDFGGCFSFRQERHSNTKISTHAWGIAIDLNPNENAQGTVGNMNVGIVDIFRRVGFKWGGNWIGRTDDPMHFQFATGY